MGLKYEPSSEPLHIHVGDRVQVVDRTPRDLEGIGVMCFGTRVLGFGFGVLGVGFRVQGSGFRA